jgi:hypothetical protein
MFKKSIKNHINNTILLFRKVYKKENNFILMNSINIQN